MNIQKPVVVHTYQPVCSTVFQPPGLGDFLRGTLALFQLAGKHGFDLRLDFTGHILSQFIQMHDTIPFMEKRKVHEFFNSNICNLEPFLASLPGDRIEFVYTHAVPREHVDDGCRAFILERFQPVSSLNDYVRRGRHDLNLDKFCTVHLRMGDDLMDKSAPSLELIDRWFNGYILPRWGQNVFVISDNFEIKKLLFDRYRIKTLDCRPVHLGLGKSTGDNSKHVRDTLAEFYLMAESEEIYQYSVYPWGSGYSDICSLLYSIPITKMKSMPQGQEGSADMATSENRAPEKATKKVLNVGGNNKSITIPTCYDGWQHDLLDIDPRGNPDVLCDARELWKLPPRQYDSIYCSHNLEHFYRHDVDKVLKGFRIILKKNGFILVRVPDLNAVMQCVIDGGLDIDDVLYKTSNNIPILVRDVIYGWHVEIEKSGNDFFAHKTGFTEKSLVNVLKTNGFSSIKSWRSSLEIIALAFISPPDKLIVDDILKSLGNC